MSLNLLKIIREKSVRLIIFDIDGTIKDLHQEHKIAIEKVLKEFNILYTKRAKFALWLNSIGMVFFKWGCLPTNSFMQKVLLYIMSVITLSDFKKFKDLYYKNYPKYSILFEEMRTEILSLPFELNIILSSTNEYNLSTKQELCKEFCVEKIRAKNYSKIIKEEKIPANSVLIIGDNFFDDFLPAKVLGCNVLLVNMYQSQTKEFFMKKR